MFSFKVAVENGSGAVSQPKRPKIENSTAKERRHSETLVEVDGKTEAHIILSPAHNPPGDPPEPEELVKALLVCFIYSIGIYLKCVAVIW
jgi:hypothetical protein